MTPIIVRSAGFRPRRSGFTLIELLTVIAIIGILAAIIIPVVGKVRLTAKRSQGLSNLRQLTMASITYANENRGRWFASQTVGGEFFSTVLTRYIGSQSGGGGAVVNSQVFYDPLLPDLGGNNFHFAPIGIYFGDFATREGSLARYNNINNIKSPGKTVFFADNFTDQNVTVEQRDAGTPPNWSQIQNTGIDIWGWPGVWAGNYYPNFNDGRKIPGPGYGNAKGEIDLARDPGAAKLGFFDGHVARLKREEMAHRIFDPRFQ